MRITEYINLTTFESSRKVDLFEVCFKYGLPQDRIYYVNGEFVLDVFKSEVK